MNTPRRLFSSVRLATSAAANYTAFTDAADLMVGVLAAVMLSIVAVPERAAAAMTKADGSARVHAGWNSAVPVHPDVPLTIGDSQNVELGFQNSLTSTLATLSAEGSQTIADIIDPIVVDPLPISWSVSATAEAGGSAVPGTLRAWARATAAQSPTSQTYEYIDPGTQLANAVTKFDPVAVGGTATALVGWDDVFTITSSMLAPGTPINIRCTVELESTVQNPHGTSGATQYLLLVPELGNNVVVAQAANYSGAFVITKSGTIGSEVGRSFELQGVLQATADATASADPFGQRSVGFMEASTLAVDTGHFYLDLDLGIDASIVSQSGTSYATPVPEPVSLAIAIVSTNTVLLSWPAPSAGFVLQQNTGLNPTNWLDLTNTPTVVTGRNQVVL